MEPYADSSVPEDEAETTKALLRAAADVDKAHKAIGRYTVQFSVLVYSMRRIWAGHVAAGDEQRRDILELAFGDIGARAISEAFFVMCKMAGNLDADEETIWKNLRNRVNDELSERNNIAHGDWLINHWLSLEGTVPPKLVRIRASSRTKPFDQRDLTIDDLEEIASRVEHLAVVTWVFGLACTHLGSHEERVRDLIEIVDTGELVQREGTVWGHPSPHGP